MSEREQPLQPPVPQQPPAPPDPIVGNEPDLITGMGGGDDPIVDGVSVETDLEVEPWSETRKTEEAVLSPDYETETTSKP